MFTATSVTQSKASRPCWAEIVTSKLGTSKAEAIRGENGFYGQLNIAQLGCLKVAHVKLRGVAVRGIRRRTEAGRSAVPYLWVATSLAGTFELDYGPDTAIICPGKMAILDLERTYVTTFAPGNDVIWLRFPRQYLEPCLAAGDQIFIDGSRGTARIAFNALKTSIEQANHLGPNDKKLVADAIMNLVSAAANEAVAPSERLRNQRNPLVRIKAYILENLSDDSMSSESIAEAHNLTPRYINKLFEAEGSSLMRWTWEQRLDHAKRSLLSESGRTLSIGDIAYAHGFKSASHFSHAFRRQFKCSPKEAARTAGGAKDDR